MPTIKNFVFCLNANNVEGNRDALGIFSVMTPEYIPGLFSFTVYFTILDLSEGEHDLTLKFKDSNGDIIASVDNAPIQYVKDTTSNLPDKYLGVNVAVNLQNVDIKHSGLYEMEVIFDKECQGTFDMYVKGKNEGR